MDYSSNRMYKNYLPCSPIYLDTPKNRGVNLFLGQSVCQVLSASEEKQYDQDQTKLLISIALAYHNSLALNNSLIVPNFVVLKPIQESGKLGWSWPGSFIASRVPGNKNLCILDTGKVRAFSIAAVKQPIGILHGILTVKQPVEISHEILTGKLPIWIKHEIQTGKKPIRISFT